MLDNFSRYQKRLTLECLFPTSSQNKCACGCGKELPKRRIKWYSNDCRRQALNIFYIVKGDTSVIRQNLYRLDRGYCRNCGVYSNDWHADHVIPVFKGGGACGLENFQTLCVDCHKYKTIQLDRIPDSDYILTTSLDILPSPNNTIRTFNKSIGKDIIGNTVGISKCATV